MICDESYSHRRRGFDENVHLFERNEVSERFTRHRPRHVWLRPSGAVPCDIASILTLGHTRMTVMNAWVVMSYHFCDVYYATHAIAWLLTIMLLRSRVEG